MHRSLIADLYDIAIDVAARIEARRQKRATLRRLYRLAAADQGAAAPRASILLGAAADARDEWQAGALLGLIGALSAVALLLLSA